MKTPPITYDIEVRFPGFKIADLDDLKCAVHYQRAIITTNTILHSHRGYIAAAYVYNLNASIVHKWLRKGMFIHKQKHERLLDGTPS